MRETEFINQNKEKWQEFEQILDGKNPNPKKMNDLFVQITDDLSYSRTFYPNRSVRVYLNTVAQRVFFLIYKNRKSHQKRLLTFWTDELPRIIYESRQAFRLSFFVFALSMIIGMLSCAMEPGFASLILSDRYVEMTKEFIESGDPMAVYKQSGEFGMFLGITMNNLYVAFLTFVLGALFILGSIIILVYNGVMVGTFQYFFIERDLFWDSFLTIWIHGTFEISAIIIAGAAGITMGQGLVFPGTYTRMQAFQKSARRGIKIMVGIVPLFVMAGFFEGYLTRQTETPDIIRGIFIGVCLFIILGYFVWYPWFRARLGMEKETEVNRLPPSRSSQIIFSSIKPTSSIFEDLFTILGKRFKPIALTSLLASTIYCLIIFLLVGRQPDEIFALSGNPFLGFSTIRQFFNVEASVLLPIMAILTFSLVTYKVLSILNRESRPEQVTFEWRKEIGEYFKAAIGTCILCILFVLTKQFAFLVMLFALPFLILWVKVMMVENVGPVKAFGRTRNLISSAFGKALGLYAILFLLGTLFFTVSESAVIQLFVGILNWVIYFEQATMDQISIAVTTLIIMFVTLLIFSMVVMGIGLLYYTMLEILEARSLNRYIENIGQKKKLRGLERE